METTFFRVNVFRTSATRDCTGGWWVGGSVQLFVCQGEVKQERPPRCFFSDSAKWAAEPMHRRTAANPDFSREGGGVGVRARQTPPRLGSSPQTGRGLPSVSSLLRLLDGAASPAVPTGASLLPRSFCPRLRAATGSPQFRAKRRGARIQSEAACCLANVRYTMHTGRRSPVSSALPPHEAPESQGSLTKNNHTGEWGKLANINPSPHPTSPGPAQLRSLKLPWGEKIKIVLKEQE